MLENSPRIVSVHSAGSTADVLKMLAEQPVVGIILHWWRGMESETRAAVELGCYFSVNPRELQRPSVLGLVPVERLLTETDHPFGDQISGSDSRPGNVIEVEQAISRTYNMSTADVRIQNWKNFVSLADITNTGNLLPKRLQSLIRSFRDREKASYR